MSSSSLHVTKVEPLSMASLEAGGKEEGVLVQELKP